MRKILFFLVSILLVTIVAILYRFSPRGITGFFPMGNATVSVSQQIKGDITALLYEQQINLTQTQDVTVEFTNVGSTTLTEKIEIRIYWNNQSKLQEMAYYYDSQVILYPGMRRTFSVTFLPPYLGVYYIKARVPYDSRVVEKWGTFIVTYTPPPPSVNIEYLPAPTRRAPTPPPAVVEEVGIPEMSLEYPESVTITRGESKLFSIIVKNTGNVSLNNIRFYISTTSLIEIDINPKSVFKLSPKESAIFLISINVPKTTPAGKYPFDFVVISNEIKEEKSIELRIVSISPVEDLYETILNYEYIILEIQNEIDSAALKGIDVKIPQNSLDKAKVGLEVAKGYYQQEKYEDAKSKLAEVKKHLEDAVYQLAVASIKIYAPAFVPIIMIIIIVIIAFILLILFLLWKKRKEKEKRPKLLRAISETET